MMNILLSSNNSQMEDSIFARRHSFAPRNFLSMLSCSTTAAGDEQLTVKDTGGGRAEERGREQVARGHAEEDRDTMSTSAATATTMASCASSSSSCCPVLATTSAIPSGAIPDSILPQGVWSRSAGRKKSHPVWTFFQDLRDSNGIGGVSCMHCDWTGDDRSPNNLKTHLKRCHDTDGVFKQFTLNMALLIRSPAAGVQANATKRADFVDS
uniref:BED-type domain-containing protein n=1 Tax=Globodera pallida TaxID=36090 RepID=A0A183BHM6_GLOPA